MNMNFLPLPGFEGYLINKQGVVRSLPKMVWNGRVYFLSREKILKVGLTNGYQSICLIRDGVCQARYLHRLLASVFIPNPENKPEINHKDGNKLNNKISNLEWCTSRENIQHAFRIGLNHGIQRFGIDNPGAKFSDNIIKQVRKLKGRQPLAKTANRFGLSITHVWNIQNNKTREGVYIYGN